MNKKCHLIKASAPNARYFLPMLLWLSPSMMVASFTVATFYLWTVIFNGSSLKLQTMVTVLTADIISVDAPKEMLTNVPFPTKGYKFSVKLRFVNYELWIRTYGAGHSKVYNVGHMSLCFSVMFACGRIIDSKKYQENELFISIWTKIAQS